MYDIVETRRYCIRQQRDIQKYIFMKISTIRSLSEVNKRFYNDQAETWKSSRNYAWPSWDRFVKNSQLSTSSEISVLDVGCGTGRLANFLRDFWPSVAYCGIDNSEALLLQAKAENPLDQFSNVDVVETLLQEQALSTRAFSLVTAFGVLHHVPSQKLRLQFIQSCLNLLNPDGELWLTIWVPEQLGYKSPQEKDWETITKSIDFNRNKHRNQEQKP